jgi:hypothetical protein
VSRLLLVHWNEAEADERAAGLRRAGHQVECHWRKDDGPGLSKVRKAPPDAILIDLSRLPAHGRTLGMYFRQTLGTRNVPLLFVEGDPEKSARVREMLPDATFCTWRNVRGAVTRALRGKVTDLVVPRSTSGYSGTPLPKKLGLREGESVALVSAPKDFRETLGALPEGVQLRDGVRTSRVVILFARRKAELARRFPPAARSVEPGGRLWIAWPKRGSPLAADLDQAEVRAVAIAAGWVDFKVCAVDADWSGLAFSRRKS